MHTLKISKRWQGLPVYVVGDVHECHGELHDKIEAADLRDGIIVQVGDNALGFPGYGKSYHKRQNQFYKERNLLFLGILGNHDNPKFAGLRYSNYKILHHYTYAIINGEKWLFVGGATSIDRIDRIEGVSYWKDEKFQLKREFIEKCDVLVTHSTPTWLGPFDSPEYYTSRDHELDAELIEERRDIGILFALAKPFKSYAGHFHRYAYLVHDGCECRILDILDIYQHKPVDITLQP